MGASTHYGRWVTHIAWDMDSQQFDSEKLLDAELTDFAAQDSGKSISVIVEIAHEPPQVEIAQPDENRRFARPQMVLPSDDNAILEQMDRLEDKLKSLNCVNVVRLDAAQAYVVSVNPDQLRRVTLLRDAGCIRQNRTH